MLEAWDRDVKNL